MKLRAALVTATVLVAGLTGIGHAAATKVCNLVTDAAGDSTAYDFGSPLPNDDSLDIVGGDIASDTKSITAIIKVKAWGASDPQGIMGRNLYFGFVPSGKTDGVFLSYQETPQGKHYSFGATTTSNGITNYTDAGEATGSFNGSEIHITASLTAMKPTADLKPGVKLATKIETFTLLGFDQSPESIINPYDTADGKSYTTGTKSCVAIGK